MLKEFLVFDLNRVRSSAGRQKSITLNLCKISKAKLVTVQECSCFHLKPIFRVAVDLGAYFISRGRLSLLFLALSRCSPLAFEPQIDF